MLQQTVKETSGLFFFAMKAELWQETVPLLL